MARRSKAKDRRAAARERMKKREERRKSSGSSAGKFQFDGDVDFLEVKKGIMRLNIVPYRVTVDNNPDAEKGDTFYSREIYVHYGIGIDDASVICPKTVNKRCPICEYRDKLIKESWDDNEDEIKSLRASQREIFNVINMDEDEDEILFFEAAYANFGSVLGEEIEYADEDDIIFGLPFPDEHPILKVRFKQKTFGKNKFFEASKITAEEGGDLDDDMVDQAIDLDKCLVIHPYDKLQKMFLQIEDPDDGDDEPAKMEDDVPINPGQDEEEEEEKPARDRRSRKKKEPEKEEEPAPEKKKRTSKRRSRKKKEENPCPAGHVFGTDCDKWDDCEACDKWDDCMDRKGEIEGD